MRPYSASEAPRLMVVVVLPTPPFWLHIEITRALPWVLSGRGSGMSGIGRPVGPRTTSSGASVSAATSTVSGSQLGRRPGRGSLERAARGRRPEPWSWRWGTGGVPHRRRVLVDASTGGSRGLRCRIVIRTCSHRSWWESPSLCAAADRAAASRCRLSRQPRARLYAPASRRQQADRDRMTPSSKSGDGLCVAPRRGRTTSASPVHKPVHGGSQAGSLGLTPGRGDARRRTPRAGCRP